MRTSLKCGGKSRKKAMLGADGAIMAAATLTAAGMNVGATLKSASQQAKAIQESTKIQAQAIKDKIKNDTTLQQESMNFTRQQNKENRDQYQDTQNTLQLLVSQENMNNRLENTKLVAKYGGRVNKLKQMQPLFYRGGNRPFTVTDGGGAIPLQTDANGYGLYEFYGNDHKHYHKTPSGKLKSGVGIKLENGKVIEVQGNQNKNIGELGYFTPTDAYLISNEDIPNFNKTKTIKNKIEAFNIPNFNPAKAVKNGMNPIEAFNIQQYLKTIYGLNDDGSRKNLPRRRKALAGMDILNTVNQTQYPQNGTVDVATGIAYATQNMPQQTVEPKIAIAKYGGHRKLKCGGRIKAENGYWQNYGGATYSAIGNIVGAGMNVLGNYFAGNMLSKAYTKAGNILADAYNQMQGISLSELNREDYSPGHIMAVIRSADTNINPQLERLRRNADNERRTVNANTLSSAARQQRLAGINDRMYQRMGEQFAYKHNEDEKIKQGNAARVQEASAQNAQLDAQARQAYGNARLNLLQYNNDIENQKIAGRAQSLADGITQSSTARSNAMVNSINAITSGLQAVSNQFASAYDTARKEKTDFTNTYIGLGNADQVKAAILRYEQTGDKSFINGLLESSTISDEERARLNSIIFNDKKNKKKLYKITPENILPSYIPNTDNGVYYG